MTGRPRFAALQAIEIHGHPLMPAPIQPAIT
jgi:hypothetical protein